MWLVPRSDLTTEQMRAVELRTDQHRVIFGAPGSGKTMVLLHRAHFLMTEKGIPPERLHIFVFTNVLKEYIRAAIHYLNIPESCITTFDSWCTDYYKEHINKRTPWKERGPDYEAIREGVREHAFAAREKLFDAVLVDEGQDLDSDVFQTLTSIGKHVTVCMDHKQQIYDNGSSELQILKSLGLRQRNMSLLEAYRCTPYIVQIASAFIHDEQERENYIRQTRVPQTERQIPLLYITNDLEDEKERLIQVVRERQLKGEKIAILFGLQRQVHGYAKGLRELGLEVETPKQFRRRADNSCIHDFSTDLPKVMPFHSAKGLTFDTVIMPRLVSSSFGKFGRERLEKLIFVGVTRATKWIYMSSTNPDSLPVYPLFESLAEQGHLSIQKGLSPNDMFFDQDVGGQAEAAKIELPDVEDDPF